MDDRIVANLSNLCGSSLIVLFTVSMISPKTCASVSHEQSSCSSFFIDMGSRHVDLSDGDSARKTSSVASISTLGACIRLHQFCATSMKSSTYTLMYDNGRYGNGSEGTLCMLVVSVADTVVV